MIARPNCHALGDLTELALLSWPWPASLLGDGQAAGQLCALCHVLCGRAVFGLVGRASAGALCSGRGFRVRHLFFCLTPAHFVASGSSTPELHAALYFCVSSAIASCSAGAMHHGQEPRRVAGSGSERKAEATRARDCHSRAGYRGSKASRAGSARGGPAKRRIPGNARARTPQPAGKHPVHGAGPAQNPAVKNLGDDRAAAT